jgi:hypothetical protein
MLLHFVVFAGGQVAQLMVYAHKVALCAARHDQLASSAAAAGASTQLLSLKLSCIKYCKHSIDSEPASCLESLEVAWLAAKAAMQLCAATSGQPISSSSTLAAVVVARSLHLTSQCFAVMLKHTAALAAADVRIGAKMPAGNRMQRLLEQLSLSLSWIRDQLQQQQQGVGILAADTKGLVRQQLLQQLQVLQHGVQQATQRSSSSSSSSQEQKLVSIAKAVSGKDTWVQQLQELAELLCANVLPQGPLWCNNPSCRCGAQTPHKLETASPLLSCSLLLPPHLAFWALPWHLTMVRICCLANSSSLWLLKMQPRQIHG